MAEPCLNRALWDVIAVWQGGPSPMLSSARQRPRSLAHEWRRKADRSERYDFNLRNEARNEFSSS